MTTATIIITIAGRPVSVPPTQPATADWVGLLNQERQVQEAMLDRLLDQGYVKFCSHLVVEPTAPYSVRIVAILWKPGASGVQQGMQFIPTGAVPGQIPGGYPQSATLPANPLPGVIQTPPASGDAPAAQTQYPPQYLEWLEMQKGQGQG